FVARFGTRKGTEMGNEAELREVQQRQLGLITREQVIDLGATRKGIDRRVGVGVSPRVLPGVYRDTLIAPSLPQSALAAQLWAGADAVIGEASAGALWALDGLGSDRMHLWTPRRVGSDLGGGD